MPAPFTAAEQLARRHRFQWWETLPWIAALAAFFAFPNYLAFATQVLITILFALSLDLVLGYAGIVTLGHAAFFGAGAYTVGMLASHFGWTEPLSGLLAAALVAGIVGLVSGLVLLRTHGLALLMLVPFLDRSAPGKGQIWSIAGAVALLFVIGMTCWGYMSLLPLYVVILSGILLLLLAFITRGGRRSENQ